MVGLRLLKCSISRRPHVKFYCNSATLLFRSQTLKEIEAHNIELEKLIVQLKKAEPLISHHFPIGVSPISRFMNAGKYLFRKKNVARLRNNREVRRTKYFSSICPDVLPPFPFIRDVAQAVNDKDAAECRDIVRLPIDILHSYLYLYQLDGSGKPVLHNLLHKMASTEVSLHGTSTPLQQFPSNQDSADLRHRSQSYQPKKTTDNQNESSLVMNFIENLLIDVHQYLKRKSLDPLVYFSAEPACVATAGRITANDSTTNVCQKDRFLIKWDGYDLPIVANVTGQQRDNLYESDALFLQATASQDAPSAVETKETPPDSGGSRDSSAGNKRDKRTPSRAQLVAAQDNLVEEISRLHRNSPSYSMYTMDVVFENNWSKKPYTMRGISKLTVEVLKFRIYANSKYAKVGLECIQSHVLEEESSVQMQWRLSGIPNSKALMFWQYFPWNYRGSVKSNATFEDVLSTFFFNGDGKIVKVRLDKMMPNRENSVNKKDSKLKIATVLSATKPVFTSK